MIYNKLTDNLGKYWFLFILLTFLVSISNAYFSYMNRPSVVHASQEGENARKKSDIKSNMDIMPCSGGSGPPRKCIRIDPSAGEVYVKERDATYKVIYEN